MVSQPTYTPTAADDWSHDAHHLNPDVHYRLYRSKRTNLPIIICVQDFDYVDYDARQILSPDAWHNEVDANNALRAFMVNEISHLVDVINTYNLHS